MIVKSWVLSVSVNDSPVARSVGCGENPQFSGGGTALREREAPANRRTAQTTSCMARPHDYMQAWVNLVYTSSYLLSQLSRRFEDELSISVVEQSLLNLVALAPSNRIRGGRP